MPRLTWNDVEVDKFVGIIYEMRMQNKRIEWPLVRIAYKQVAVIDRTKNQLRSLCDSCHRKLNGYEALIRATEGDVNEETLLPIVIDEQWATIKLKTKCPNFIQYEPINNVEKLRFIFSNKAATSALSFAPGMDPGQNSVAHGIEDMIVGNEEGLWE